LFFPEGSLGDVYSTEGTTVKIMLPLPECFPGPHIPIKIAVKPAIFSDIRSVDGQPVLMSLTTRMSFSRLGMLR
jgi:hypothetical protein